MVCTTRMYAQARPQEKLDSADGPVNLACMSASPIYVRLLALVFFGASAWLNAASAIKRVRFIADATDIWYQRVRSPALWWLPEIMPAITVCAAGVLGVLLVWRAFGRP